MSAHAHATLDDTLRAIERSRIQALVQRDMAVLRRLHAPEYQLITPAGRTFTRERYLGAIEAEATSLAGGPIPIVDSAVATADEVAGFLAERGQTATRAGTGRLSLLVTDLPKSFAAVAARFLGEPVGADGDGVEQIDL